MTNSNQNYNKEVQQGSYTDPNGHTHTNITQTEKTISNNTTVPNSESYRNGYASGVVSERRYQQENLAKREDNSISGLIIGFLLALAAVSAGAFWYFAGRQETVQDTATPAPVLTPSPEAKQTPPQKEITIIEKTRDVPVPVLVPQQPAPTPAAKQDINISVPNPLPKQTETTPSKADTQSDRTTPPESSQTPNSTSDSTSTNGTADSNQ
ncbi:MAG: hypothetical protein KME21_21085 [Desmonostoc vinosum HA7617-LM4]|jgi:hypothetical protein|nr:hypothetical protein [Desmonostoc vinosum HA7617-LM4]